MTTIEQLIKQLQNFPMEATVNILVVEEKFSCGSYYNDARYEELDVDNHEHFCYNDYCKCVDIGKLH